MVHVWFLITAYQMAICQLSHVFEHRFFFVHQQNKTIDVPFVVANNSTRFGLVLESDVDFNMIFALTCMSLENESCDPCPRTSFLVVADGPCQSNIQWVNYEQAFSEAQNLQFILKFPQNS